MNAMALRTVLFAAGLLVFSGNAQAQRGNYDLMPMNFDLWCFETAKLDSTRCARRLPADIETFEAYRARIEAYEIPHLQQKNRAARIETDILHGDPVDRSPTRSLQRQPGGVTTPSTSAVP